LPDSQKLISLPDLYSDSDLIATLSKGIGQDQALKKNEVSVIKDFIMMAEYPWKLSPQRIASFPEFEKIF